jgi:GGDEF domain-containing protein
VPQATAGWLLGELQARVIVTVAELEPLLDDLFLREGCYLLTNEEARSRLSSDIEVYPSQLNGRGPWAWNRHWLIVPLKDGEGALLGVIWVDNPSDRLLPSPDRLQALRIFANAAAAALVSGRQLGELRFLAHHDPLTRLLNRRAFMNRLDGEVARAQRYGRPLGLVITDLDGFKQLNDRHGHAAGDEALVAFANVLVESLRKPDDAFRIGGDEFAVLLAEARTMRGSSSSGSEPCSTSKQRTAPAGSEMSGRASAMRRVPSTRAIRRRSSASPTKPSTRRSATARAWASSRARKHSFRRYARAGLPSSRA